ncbi:MAG: rod shape-determining protein MreC [bacterium]
MGIKAFLKVRVFIPIALSFLIIIINPEKLRDSFRRVIIPIELLGGKIRGASSHFNEAVKDNIRLTKEKEELKREIVLLTFKYAKQDEILQENKRLREILNFKEKTNFKPIIANTLGFSSSAISSTIIIDRGLKDGIKKGFSVVCLFKEKEVFIGRVIDVFPLSSLVLLITDPEFFLPVRLKVTREKGLLEGQKDKMELKFIENKIPVRQKESVLTVQDEFIPDDILIGYVDNISSKKSGLFRKVFVKPAISFSRLEEVLVLVP